MLVSSLQGLPAFAAYFFGALALCAVYLIIYTRITPVDEYDQIVHHHNASAAVALGMSLLGFAIPLASAIFYTAGIVDCAVWGVVALLVQLLAYWLARLAHPGISAAIAQGSLASALWLGFVSITAGILSAAAMSP